MKTMTCKQLGGSCLKEFKGDTFEEIALLSKQHGMAMLRERDAEHLAAMETMKSKMQDPSAMQEWMNAKKKAFDALADEQA